MPSKAPHGIFELAPSPTLGLTTALVYGAVALLLLIAGLIAYLYWRKKSRRLPGIAPALTPWERLHSELKASAAAVSTVEAMRILNHTLRHSLELRLNAPYTAYTSGEILTHLQKNSDFSSDFQAECAEFLKIADKVQFAYQHCDEAERRRWEQRVGQWLNSLQIGQAL